MMTESPPSKNYYQRVANLGSNERNNSEAIADLVLVRRLEAANEARQQLVGMDPGSPSASEWQRIAEDGENAQRTLVERFDGLVRYVANRVMSSRPSSPMEFDDAYQIGWEHALKAVQRYGEKEENETPLRVYVGNYMDNLIQSQMPAHRLVRLPANAESMVSRTLAVNQQRIERKLPIMSDTEMGELLEIPVGSPSIPPYANTTGNVHLAIGLTRLMGSTDSGLSPSADFSEGNKYDTPMRSIFDERTEDEVDPTGDEATRRAMIGRFGVIMDKLYDEAKLQQPDTELSERELQVLRMRYGFFDGAPKSLMEIGKMFGLTEIRIRQLERSALGKLQRNPDIKSLQPSDTDDPASVNLRRNFW